MAYKIGLQNKKENEGRIVVYGDMYVYPPASYCPEGCQL